MLGNPLGWSLDLRTCIVFSALVTLATGLLLLATARSLPRSIRPSLPSWLTSVFLAPAGLLLVATRGLASDWLSVVLANTLIALSLGCMAMAMRIFHGLPQRRAWHLGTALVVATLATWFTFVQAQAHTRAVLVSLLLAALMASSARAVFRRDGARGRVPRLTASLYALSALAMLVRVGRELAWPAATFDLMNPSATNLATLGLLVLLPGLSTVGFLLMCSERNQEELERTARMDHLTGIFNRRAIEDLASHAMSASRRHGIPMAIMLVDVDRFKRINDDHGHEAGDQALVETVGRMREVMRSEDLVGRQGGEEFVAVMPDMDLAGARAAAERLCLNFAERAMSIANSGGAVDITVTVSIGVAALDSADVQFSHLLRRADRAMYAAKAAGRNQVCVDSHSL